MTPPLDDTSPAVLVARFLRQNDYDQTLDAFLAEAGLPPATGLVEPGKEVLTLEKVLQEKHTFDLSVNFEKVTVDDGSIAWSASAPSMPHVVQTLPTAANVLHVGVETFHGPDGNKVNLVIASTADKSVHTLADSPPYDIYQRLILPPFDSPVLSHIVIASRFLIMTSMSGRLTLYDLRENCLLASRQDHRKYVVQVAHCENENGAWIATAGWDAKVFVYRMHYSGPNPRATLFPPFSTELPTNPESILFVKNPKENKSPILILSRRDSTFLHYYTITVDAMVMGNPLSLTLHGKQNLAPHANAWISFTPCSLALSPTQPSLLAVATSAVPYMKLLIVRLLIPPTLLSADGDEVHVTDSGHATQSSQARASLALQEREASAIQLECSTLAPQTPYSTPALAWRPDGSGVWVNGDDGVVRGIEVSSGKIAATLKNGHEPGSKVRCLWAGMAGDKGSEEYVISGGFDKKLIIWKQEKTQTDV